MNNQAQCCCHIHFHKGTIVYIPYMKMFIVPSDTIHVGGFMCGISVNLRFYLYIAVAVGDDEEEDL